MKAEVKKPPDSPTGNVEEWNKARQKYVDASWEAYGQTISIEPAGQHEKTQTDNQRHETEDQEADDGEIEGNLRPLISEGERVMVCIRYRVVATRFGIKDYLYWRELYDSPILEQFFRHYEKNIL